MERRKVYIYGAGQRFIHLCNLVAGTEYCIAGVFDGNEALVGKKISGHVVQAKTGIQCLTQMDNLCISIENRDIYAKVLQYIKGENPLISIIKYEEIVLSIFRTVVHGFSIRPSHNQKLPYKTVFDCPNGIVLGGVETWSLALAKELNQIGLISKVVGPKNEENSLDIDQEYITQLNVKTGFVTDFESVKRYIEFLASALPCNVITCGANAMMVAACVLKEQYRDDVKIISVIHNREKKLIDSHAPYMKYIDHVIAVSEEILDDIEMYYPDIISEKMTLPFVCSEKLIRDFNLDKTDPLKICFVGRITKEQKRADLMIKILENLDKREIRYECRFAGTGDYEDRIKNYRDSRSCTVASPIIFMGKIKHEDINRFFFEQDVYINCSDYEGNCISKLEAMGCGVVPITTKTSGIKGIVMDGENGFVVEKEDYLAIVDRIDYLDRNRELLLHMGEQANRIVYPLSSMKKHVEQWMTILKD